MTLDMCRHATRCFALSMLVTLLCARSATGEILIRWDEDRIPSPQSLGISTIVVPAAKTALMREALRQGYRLLLELDTSAVPAFKLPAEGVVGVIVTGAVPAKQAALLEKQLKPAAIRILTSETRGKWPHIRTNWVTKNKDVLQVSSRSAQPWIENNAALLRIAASSQHAVPSVLTYPWQPITLADVDEGPALENYLVAIAEAGSFGGDLLLPLHPQFERKLLLGDPRARLDWKEILRYIEFFSWDLPQQYRSIVDVGVVTAEPTQSFEVMNLMRRHNVPFELIAPLALGTRKLDALKLLLLLDGVEDSALGVAADFARRGGVVVVSQPRGVPPWRSAAPVVKTDDRVTYRLGEGTVIEVLRAIADPNAFALEVRQLLGAKGRVIDIWNGITVLAAPYASPDGASVLVTAVNYAHQPLQVQLRVRGTFSVVHLESPEEALTLLPYQHRGGYTEFVLPSLRVGGRIFLSD